MRIKIHVGITVCCCVSPKRKKKQETARNGNENFIGDKFSLVIEREDEIISCAKLISPPLNDHLPPSEFNSTGITPLERSRNAKYTFHGDPPPIAVLFPLRSRFFLSVSKRRLLHRFSHERFTVDLSPILSCSSIGLFWNHQFLKESLWTKRRKSGCFNNESCYWRSFLFECDLNIYIYMRGNGLTCWLYVNVDTV